MSLTKKQSYPENPNPYFNLVSFWHFLYSRKNTKHRIHIKLLNNNFGYATIPFSQRLFIEIMKKQGKHLNLHERLIDECRLGNRKSQFEIYKLYYKAMFNTSYRIVSNFSEAEDIMQEAFLKAFQNLNKFKGEVSFGAWLKRIVVNQSLDQLRKRKIEFLAIDDEEEFNLIDETESSEGINSYIKLDEVKNEINKLPEGFKLVLSLYLLEGYDHDEIAEILKISPSTSRSQFLRAKKRLIQNVNRSQNLK